MRVGDKVKIVESHRQDFEKFTGTILEIKEDNPNSNLSELKYHVRVSKYLDVWAYKVEQLNG